MGIKSGDNIKAELGEVICKGVDCIRASQDRDQWRAVVDMAVNLRVP
jgi:hypothetical protein